MKVMTDSLHVRSLWKLVVVASSTIWTNDPIPSVYHSPFTTALRNFGNDLSSFAKVHITPSSYLFAPAFFDWPTMCSRLTKNAGTNK